MTSQALTYTSPQIAFATQQNGEQIQLLLRRHFITNIFWIETAVVLAILPLVWAFIPRTITESIVDQSVLTFLAPYLIILLPLYYTGILFYAFLKFLAWFFSVIIITNRRVLDIDYLPPLIQHTTQAQLEEIQDISEKQSGLFATLFNFGDILIQTAGTNQNIFLRRTPNPHEIHTQIMQLLHQNSRGRRYTTSAVAPNQP